MSGGIWSRLCGESSGISQTGLLVFRVYGAGCVERVAGYPRAASWCSGYMEQVVWREKVLRGVPDRPPDVQGICSRLCEERRFCVVSHTGLPVLTTSASSPSTVL